jgi:hypothetical protein
MKFLLKFLIVLSLILFLIYYGFNISYIPPKENDVTKQCLDKMGLREITWKIAVFSSVDETDVALNYLWQDFSDVDRWISWASPMHISAKWVRGNEFLPGNRFIEVLNLGFPLKNREAVETIFEGEKEKIAIWSEESNGIKSCHGWQFIKLANGHTQIVNAAVFEGKNIGLSRPFINSPWQSMFDEDVKSLVRKSINN